jgi:hypothetical protein
LLHEFGDVCRELKETGERWDAARPNYVADLSHVIARWHSDTQYLNSRGSPLALPLNGRGPSLHSLIRRVLPAENTEAVVRSLLELKGIRRRGQVYAPTDRHLTYTRQPISALAHGLTSLLGMLRTVEHNIKSPRARRLFERTAINPRLPVAELPSFHRRFTELAGDFIWSIDGDMRRREEKHAKGRRTRLGVGIFAFEEPRVSGPKRRGKAAPARRMKARRS